MSVPASRTERVAEFVRFVAVGGSAALLYITLASLLTVYTALPTWLSSTIAWRTPHEEEVAALDEPLL
jgi:putative flippase GtrA